MCYSFFRLIYREKIFIVEYIAMCLSTDHQCGFWHDGSTTDQIIYIWQIQEKKWEYNGIMVHQLFKDLKKANDSVSV
jgi:hypothetical protein